LEYQEEEEEEHEEELDYGNSPYIGQEGPSEDPVLSAAEMAQLDELSTEVAATKATV
jgi:hypothetical protein